MFLVDFWMDQKAAFFRVDTTLTLPQSLKVLTWVWLKSVCLNSKGFEKHVFAHLLKANHKSPKKWNPLPYIQIAQLGIMIHLPMGYGLLWFYHLTPGPWRKVWHFPDEGVNLAATAWLPSVPSLVEDKMMTKNDGDLTLFNNLNNHKRIKLTNTRLTNQWILGILPLFHITWCRCYGWLLMSSVLGFLLMSFAGALFCRLHWWDIKGSVSHGLSWWVTIFLPSNDWFFRRT